MKYYIVSINGGGPVVLEESKINWNRMTKLDGPFPDYNQAADAYDKITEEEFYTGKYHNAKVFDSLSSIRSQLFDAPADIKSAFNNVVKYLG